MKKLAGTLFLTAALMLGCTVAPQLATAPAAASPQVAVFAADGAYEAALVAAVAYARLPRCAAAVPQPCSQQGVVDQTVRARDVARDALAAARTAVRTPGFGADVGQTAVAAAQAAVQALTAITVNLTQKVIK